LIRLIVIVNDDFLTASSAKVDHSLTFLRRQALMNEGQAKAYLGWSQTSKMLGTYAHLTTSDANNANQGRRHACVTQRTRVLC
jgi:hypothetical protein